jgi:hypothetical protein
MKGFVDFLRIDRGFGFAYDMDKKVRYFFFMSNVVGEPPQVGSLIDFVPGETLKGPVALKVHVLDRAEIVAAMLDGLGGDKS